MDAQAEILALRRMVQRLRRSRTLLLRLLNESLREQEALQARLEQRAVSNVRRVLPRSAQDRDSTP